MVRKKERKGPEWPASRGPLTAAVGLMVATMITLVHAGPSPTCPLCPSTP